MTGASLTDRDVDIDLRRLCAALWEKKWAILVAVLAVGAAALLLTSFIHPLYQAETRILIDPRNVLSGTADSAQSANQPILDERGVSSQVEIIRSTDLLKSVAAKLDLAKRTEFDATEEPSLVSRLLGLVGLADDPRDVPPEERVLEKFRDKLSVFQVENSRVIVIQFSSEDPKLAALVPNALADAYLARQSGIKLEDNTDATAWLQPEIARLRDKVHESEANVADYRAKTDLLMVSSNDTLASRELADTASELSRVRSERADAEARAANVRDALKNGRGVDTLANVVGSPLIQQLRQQEIAAQAQLAQLSTTLMDRHPQIMALKSQLRELDRRIDTESRKVLGSLENEAKVARLREQELTAQMTKLKANSAEAGEQQVRLQALEREAAADRDLLNTYLARYREANSRSSLDALPADARIISRAVVPGEPYYPKTVPILVVAVVATFLVSAIAIMLAELFSGRALRPVVLDEEVDHVFTEEEWIVATDEPAAGKVVAFHRATAETAVAPAMTGADAQDDGDGASPSEPIAASDDALLAAANAVVPNEEDVAPDARPEDQDFSIAAAAEHLIGKEAARVVCVSPEGDEGSAATVVLARLIAEEGFRTILIDMTASACPTKLMATNEDLPGITDLLTGETPFAETIHGDRLSPSHLIPHGLADAGRAMRAAERLPMVIDALTDAYDFVIIECGPTDVDGVDRLARRGLADLIVNVIEPDDSAVAEALSDFYAAGYGNLIVMMPGLVANEVLSAEEALDNRAGV